MIAVTNIDYSLYMIFRRQYVDHILSFFLYMARKKMFSWQIFFETFLLNPSSLI